jgi:hypothetical protein
MIGPATGALNKTVSVPSLIFRLISRADGSRSRHVGHWHWQAIKSECCSLSPEIRKQAAVPQKTAIDPAWPLRFYQRGPAGLPMVLGQENRHIVDWPLSVVTQAALRLPIRVPGSLSSARHSQSRSCRQRFTTQPSFAEAINWIQPAPAVVRHTADEFRYTVLCGCIFPELGCI